MFSQSHPLSKKILNIFLAALVSSVVVMSAAPAYSSEEHGEDTTEEESPMIGWQKGSNITWSIDTSNLDKPHRYRRAARDALAMWEPTGHTFTYVPSGGAVSIVFSSKMNPEWGGYGGWSKVTPCGENSWRIREGNIVVNTAYPGYGMAKRIIAHEMGHVFGMTHVDDPTALMHKHTGFSGGVTPVDLEYEKSLQRDCPE